MKLHWFRRAGIVFVPASLQGWLILAAGAAYCVFAFIDIDRKSHSVSDTMMNFVFIFLITGAAYSLVAYLTGGDGSPKENDGPGSAEKS